MNTHEGAESAYEPIIAGLVMRISGVGYVLPVMHSKIENPCAGWFLILQPLFRDLPLISYYFVGVIRFNGGIMLWSISPFNRDDVAAMKYLYLVQEIYLQIIEK